MPQWGADNANTAQEPSWGYINNEFRGSQNTVSATVSGWGIVHPWGTETVVAIGGLTTTLAAVTFENISGNVGHTASETLAIRIRTNYGVQITDANTANVYVVAISSVANTANVNLAYSAADSTPESGELVFKKTLDLSAYGAGATFTVNASSTLHGAVGVVARKPTHNPTLSTANGTTFAASANVNITTV